MELLVENSRLRVFQRDAHNDFLIETTARNYSFNICGLMACNEKLKKINLASILLDDQHPGVEIIYLACIQEVLVLDILDLIRWKDALSEAIAILEINSQLHQVIYRTHF